MTSHQTPLYPQSQERGVNLGKGKQQLYACIKDLLKQATCLYRTHTHTQWLLFLREGRSCTHYVKDKRNFVGRGVQDERKHVYLWLIHADVWQKPSHYCKVIICQLNSINKILKR